MHECLSLILVLGEVCQRMELLMEEVAGETGIQPPNWAGDHLPLHIALHRPIATNQVTALVQIVEKAMQRTRRSEMILASNLCFSGGNIILPVVMPLTVASFWTEVTGQLRTLPGFQQEESDAESILCITIAKGVQPRSDWSQPKIQTLLTKLPRIPFCMTAVYQRPVTGGQWERAAAFQV